MLRDYRPEDFETIKRIHADSKFPYQPPQMNVDTPEGTKLAPLWLVTKVLEVDGVVRAALGSWIQVELFLWLDKSDWTDAKGKMVATQQLETAVLHELWLKGIDHAVLFVPPGLNRWARRLEEDFGFIEVGDGWRTFAKRTRA
jgi:hypothetical protein